MPNASEAQPDDLLTTRTRVRALRFGAVLLIAFGLIDLAFRSVGAGALLVRMGWAACALLAAEGIARGQSGTRLLVLLGVASPVFYAALLQDHGGAHGVAFAFFLAVPVVFSVLLRGEVEAAIATSVSNLVAGLAVVPREQPSTDSKAQWAAALVSSGAIAIYAAILHRNFMASQRSLERDRLLALEDAKQSEAARLRTDQVALLGMLAAGLGHEVNNPLAVLTANLGFVAEGLKDRARSLSLSELAELTAENEHCVQRIAGVMREIGALVPSDREAQDCDLVPLVRQIVEEKQARRFQLHDGMPAALPLVRAFAPQVLSILRQLVLSASESSMTSSPEQPVEVWITASAEAGGVLLVLEDNGAELWPDAVTEGRAAHSEHRGSNSGVGFALVRESLRQWGATVTVSRRAGGGARVALRFRAQS